jgi:hypothetical protein
MDDALKDKIRRLLRLAGSSNEHEAALAAQRAQELMLKHGIEQSALDIGEELEIDYADEPIIPHTAKMPSWKLRLAVVVASANTCRIITFSKYAGPGNERNVYTKRAVLLGNKKKLAAVNYFYSILESEIERLTLKFKGGKRQKLAYRHGLIDTIAVRLYEALRTVDTESNGAAMVLVNKEKAAIEARMRAEEIKKAKDRQLALDEQARRQGVRDGHDVALTQALEAGASVRKLGSGS